VIRKLLAGAALFAALAFSSRAQHLGDVAPQTTRTIVANAVVCTAGGVTNTIPVSNVGQTTHFVIYTTTGTANFVNVSIQAVELTGTSTISDVATSTSGGALSANGYYSVIQVIYTCRGNGGTITIVYEGVSSTSAPVTGTQDQAAYSKTIVTQQSAGTPLTVNLATPYGNTCGQIRFNNIATQAGTTLSVTTGNEDGVFLSIVPTTTMGSSGETAVNVPCVPSQNAVVTITPGGAGNYTAVYNFVKPGHPATADPCQNGGYGKTSAPINVTTATTTQLVAISGNATVYVCGVTMTIAPSGTTADTATFEYGTGANCGTGTTALTGALGAGDLTTTTGLLPVSFADPGTSFRTPPGNALCLLSAGTTVNIQGFVTYVQQ
jgi:hypothetical protein